jgi:spore maturation protein A
MLNFLWAGMIGIGIIYGAFTGKMTEISEAILEASKEAVSLCITMVGVMSLWMGLMEIASKAGILEALSKMLKPVIRFLFPHIPKDHKANEYITSNFVANMLGLGWAATPAGLQAMEVLSDLEEERRKKVHPLMRPKEEASDEMCTFLILNMSSLQLIPVNIIAYRSQYGSVNSAEIIGAGLAATAISTLTAIIFCKIRTSSLTFLGSKRRR